MKAYALPTKQDNQWRRQPFFLGSYFFKQGNYEGVPPRPPILLQVAIFRKLNPKISTIPISIPTFYSDSEIREAIASQASRWRRH